MTILTVVAVVMAAMAIRIGVVMARALAVLIAVTMTVVARLSTYRCRRRIVVCSLSTRQRK